MEFKSQICTTHEQSKRLLALGLKPETADMVYHHTKSKVPALEWELQIRIGTSENVFGLHHETSDAWLLSYPYVKSFETASPVESCVLAIDWLIANGHFNKEYYNEENNVQ